ncbi:MAG: phosphopantetheine-binding protein [Candidatus Competibacteraceae bacterium]
MATCDEVKLLLAQVLQLGERAQKFDRSTPLMGSLPEFDSMMVISLITALEEHFDITIQDDEIGADMFETVGNLCDFVEGKLGH